MSLSVSEAKIVAMATIGVGSFLVGLFPACFTNRRTERKLLLSALLCFGAGVLLATSLLHMLPETREFLPHYAELIFCSGFLLLYMIDEIVHFIWGKLIDPPPELHSHQGTRQGHSHSHASAGAQGYGHSHASVGNSVEGHHHPKGLQVPASCVVRASDGTILDQNSYQPTLKNSIACIQDRGRVCYGSIPEVQPPVSNEPAPCCEEEGSLLCHGPHTEPCANTNTGLAGLLMALTLHAILEGLAIGLQTQTSDVLLLLAAVASHKLVVGFCLGIELATTVRSFLRHAIAIGVFAGGSSAGIAIGMIVTQVEENWITSIVMPLLQGLAGGSLLYVTVSEVLPRERARWHRTTKRVAGITQFSSVTCGFFLMFILNEYT